MTVVWRSHHLRFQPPHLLPFNLPQIRHCSSVAAIASPSEQVVRTWQWKKLDSKELGISNSMISEPTRLVLNALKRKGYEAYLVGGCVRDLILRRIPKDFDIITSAELNKVRSAFRRCQIVGKRFPICQVHVNGTVVEVSSFSTSARKARDRFNHDFRKPPDCSERDYIRWRNCLQRDFTINGLMFDPYEKIVYDYVGGMKDIKKTKVRTVIPANLSFLEDCGKDSLGTELHVCLRVSRSFFEITLEIRASGDTFAYPSMLFCLPRFSKTRREIEYASGW